MRFHRILVPTDFSPGADAAFDAAIELARTFGSTVVLMHSYGPPFVGYPGLEQNVAADYMNALEHAARDALNSALASRKESKVTLAAALYAGVPWEQILRAVQEHQVDLVVMGTHGRRGLTHALLGSVAEKVVRMCPVPVLTVRPPAEESGSAPQG